MKNKEQYLTIGEALIGEEQVMEMAKYINHLEQENAKLLGELQQTKSYLSVTVQQRNSAEIKYQNLLEQINQPVIPITNAVVINTKLDSI